MKKRIKTNTTAKKTATKKRKSVNIVLPNHSLWRHFGLVEHKHTGKLLHRRHTSHLSLFMGLAVLGFFMYASGSMTVGAVTYNGSVTVGALVMGPPPSVGAIITSPVDGSEVTDKSSIVVNGTCPSGTFISVKNNNVLSGSTICGGNGTFSLQIQVGLGDNVISVRNYDNYNQAGPVTPTVRIIVKASDMKPNVAPIEPVSPDTSPTLPENPSIIPGKDGECDDYQAGNMPTDSVPHVAVACVPRLFLPGIEQTLGVVTWGGNPPYIVNIDWNDGSGSKQYSFETEGYHLITFRYVSAGVYKINFKLTDAKNKQTVVQTAVQVNGTNESLSASTSNDDMIIDKTWFETPVPLYVMAVALTLGFWGGDVFDRKFGYGNNRRRAKRAV